MFINYIKEIGKGPGYIALGMLEAVLGSYVITENPDAALSLAGLFTAINGFVFPAGAWKVHSEAKYLSPFPDPKPVPVKEESKP